MPSRDLRHALQSPGSKLQVRRSRANGSPGRRSPGRITSNEVTLKIAATLALLGTAVTALAQQTPPAKKTFQEFEVASIRENKSSETGTGMNFPLGTGDAYKPNGGHFSVTNMPLSGYIAFAWKITPSQSAALSPQLPEWVKVTRYDIEARVEGEPTKDDMRTMMRALLADRFHLKLHSETREVAVFDMILARPGKTGPSLKAHPADDANCLLTHAPEGFFSPCGVFGAMPGLPAKMAGRNIPLQLFADNISNLAGHPVVDKTGLTGNFDFTLIFQPDNITDPKPEETAPSFRESLAEQDGFKLVPAKGTAVFYLFDHIERPSPN